MRDTDAACANYIAREPVKYKKGLFRAFLNLTREECDEMTWQEYMDNAAVLENVLKMWHAPFMKHDE